MGMMARRVARVAVGSAVMAGTANAVTRHQNKKWAAQDQAAYNDQMANQQMAAQQAAPVQTAPAQSDLTVQLEELNNLKNQGIITQEEFDAKKKILLGI